MGPDSPTSHCSVATFRSTASAQSHAAVGFTSPARDPETGRAVLRRAVELLMACEEAGIAFVPFFPLGGGTTDLSGDRLAEVAERHGATVPQIALAWLLASSPVTLAVPGTGSLTHLAENTAAGSITLTPEDLADLA